MYDSTERFSWQSGNTEKADERLEFLFSKGTESWTEAELMKLIAPLSPSSTDIQSLWNLAVGLAGQQAVENLVNRGYIHFAYQEIEHPGHWTLFPNSSWDDDSDVEEMPQSLMANLLVEELSF